MIEKYISYYNKRWIQRGLGVLMSMEKHHNYLSAAQQNLSAVHPRMTCSD
jgi:hypothetical protein